MPGDSRWPGSIPRVCQSVVTHTPKPREESAEGWAAGVTAGRGELAGVEQAVGKEGCPLKVMLVRVGFIFSTDQPERAPCIEAAAVKFGYDVEALLGELGFQQSVPESGQE